MKNLIKLVTIIFFSSLLLVSCKSDADILKDATEQIIELSEKMKDAKSITEVQTLSLKCQKVVNSLPEKFKSMSNEDALQVEGTEDFLAAVTQFSVATIEAQGRLLGNTSNAFSNMESSLNSLFDE